MMVADTTSGIQFGQVPNQARPLIGMPRQKTTGFDVSKVPNGFTGQVVGQITAKEIPNAFGGTGTTPASGNTLLAAQIQSNAVAPRQVTGGSTPTFKFASTEGQTMVDAKGGVGNLNREQAKKQAGVASDDVVSGIGASYTGT